MLGLLPALNGLTQSTAQFDQASRQIARTSLPPSGGTDTVDLSTAAVALLQSRNNFEANTKVIKVSDEMEKALIDTLG